MEKQTDLIITDQEIKEAEQLALDLLKINFDELISEPNKDNVANEPIFYYLKELKRTKSVTR